MSYGFCGRCWNFVDFCDCLNYEYDLEFEKSEIIPDPPEDQQPEVGSIWYFVCPIRELALLLEANKAEKVGLALLLGMENLWSLNPPPGDFADYISIPVDRLHRGQPQIGGPKYFDMYVQPWDMNFFNYNGPALDKIAELAVEIMECNKKKVGKKLCKAWKLGKSFFEAFRVDEVPVPPKIKEAIEQLSGDVSPEVLLAIILTGLPQEVIEKLNEYALTAIDYDWVHRQLVNGSDPDEGYEDKTQSYNQCIAENDFLCTHGSYPFPLPSDSIAMGDSDMERQAKKPKAHHPWIVCRRGVCELAKNQNRDKYGKALRDALGNILASALPGPPKPIFEDIIPHEDPEDDSFFTSTLINPPNSDLVARTSFPYGLSNNAPFAPNPVAVNLLQFPGTNQTQFLNAPTIKHDINPDQSVVTILSTQFSVAYVDFIFIGNSVNGGSAFNKSISYIFTRVTGSDSGLSFIQNGVTTNVTATAGVLNYTVNYTTTIIPGFQFLYKLVSIRGLDTPYTNTDWKITISDNTGIITGWKSRFNLLSTCLFAPPIPPPFQADGSATNFNLTPGVTYASKTIVCNPVYQIPIGFSILNEINLLSYAPNTYVPGGTFGYSVGRSGGVGGSGSIFIPFNPTGIITPVTYTISFSKSQGQSKLSGLLSYP